MRIKPTIRALYNSTELWSFIFMAGFSLLPLLFLTDFPGQPFYPSTQKIEKRENRGLGEPIQKYLTSNSNYDAALLTPTQNLPAAESENFIFLNDGSILGAASPIDSSKEFKKGITKYRVKKGDTLEKIAAKFEISTDTIKWANLGAEKGLKPGQSLIILPVSGVLHEIKENNTLKSLAGIYNTAEVLIKKYNPDYAIKMKGPGSLLIIPNAHPVKEVPALTNVNLGEGRYYFTLPTRGWNWGKLHPTNAVDIANDCGDPVYASAEGIIIEESGNKSWNHGYGNFILIEHPNGTRTKYSHNEKNLVKIGDYVKQGQEIAKIGAVGSADGCHLHFEVLGAKNPFVIQ